MSVEVKKILLITEKEYDIAEELSQHLGPEDYEALHAPDAVSALTLALREKPALIILDRDMSNGSAPMIKKLLKNFRFLKETPVFFLVQGKISKSSKVHAEDESMARLKKSHFSKEVFETIKTILTG